MFGFIASPCPRCTSSEFPAWRGAFCGLARCLARDYSAPARLLVNRDATFLSLVGLSLDPRPPAWKSRTCCNPLATPFAVEDTHPAIRHAAAVSLCGLATKLEDDREDERGPRQWLATAGAKLTRPAVDRAVGELNSASFPTAHVLDLLGGQSRTEADAPSLADQATAQSFGIITGHLATLLDQPNLQEPLTQLGEDHGRLVYWRDAWDDRDQDARAGRFNPFHAGSEHEILDRVSSTWQRFVETLRHLPFERHAALIQQIGDTTGQRHGTFLGFAATETQERKRRKKKEKDSRCDHCSPCDSCCHCPCSCGRGSGSGGACDACFDCGPGDTGCCDCCPCDGCSCS